jgi:hypothetical protein
MKKDIQTRTSAMTADMQVQDGVEQTFNFPTLGVSVKAVSFQEALSKAKELIKTNN